MGGGDLNMKKSWHPLLMVNQERVWKQEKKAYEERKKLEELKRERDQEREMQELQRIQEEAGGKKRQEKVDWMYATPSTGGGPSASEMEDYLLGKKRVDKLLRADETTQLSKASTEESFMAIQNANTAQDLASKVREDPLLAIKRQEQAAYEALLKDPTRLRELRKAHGLDTGEDKEARRRRKEEKRREKEERRAARHERYGDGKRHRSGSRSLSPPRRSPARHSDDRRPHADHHSEHRRRSRSPEPRRTHDRYDDRRPPYARDDRDGRDARDVRDSRDARYPRDARDSRDAGYEGRRYEHDDRHRSHEREPSRQQNGHARTSYPPPPHRTYHRPAPAPSGGSRSGSGSGAPSGAGEDAAAKLARMMGNAAAVDAERKVLLSRVEAEDAAERAQQAADQERARKRYGAHGRGDAPKAEFLIQQQRSLLGGKDADLADRLARAKQSLQRMEAD